MLFTEVLNCIQTNNLELKKLVYLYIMNYAKTQPDRAILAVNTFQNVRLNIFLSCASLSALPGAPKTDFSEFLYLSSSVYQMGNRTRTTQTPSSAH